MPFCVQCGAKLEEGAKFCTVCGAKAGDRSAPAPAAPAQPRPTGAPVGSYDPTIYSAGQGGGARTPTQKVKVKISGLGVALIILAALVVLGALVFIIFSVTGSGKTDTDDPVLGLYTAQTAESNGITVSVDTVWKKGFTIELKNKGKAAINVDGQSGNAKWTLDGENFTIKGTGRDADFDCSGTLADGTLILEDVLGSGVTLYLTKEGAEVSPKETKEPAPAVEPAPAETSAPAVDTPVPAGNLGWWDGEWYGWWYVSDAGGLYEEYEYAGYFWDACARIEMDGRNGYIECWDEDNDYVVTGDFVISEGLTAKGSLSNVKTEFWDYEMPAGEWDFDPGDSEFSDVPNTIVLYGRYEDPENEGSWFEYTIFLRPWGERWENLDEDLLPRYYAEWYLPLIEAGEPMPEYFEGLE